MLSSAVGKLQELHDPAELDLIAAETAVEAIRSWCRQWRRESELWEPAPYDPAHRFEPTDVLARRGFSLVVEQPEPSPSGSDQTRWRTNTRWFRT